MNNPKLVEGYEGRLELHVPATLKAMPTQWRTNTNDKEWGIATVEVTYPNGQTKRANAALYKDPLDRIVYEVGMDIILNTQIEGEYAGNATVRLPGAERVDLSLFDAEIKAGLEQFRAKQAQVAQTA